MSNILIVGAGAVGCYYGWKLSQAGASVSTVSRSDYSVVKSSGVQILTDEGTFIFYPDEVVRSTGEYSKKADYVIVCLKALPEIDVVEIIRPVVSSETVIVLIQNGIGIEKKISSSFPDNELISSIAYIASSKVGEGVVKQQDYSKLVMGNYPEGLKDKTKKLCSLFEGSGVPCFTTEKIEQKRWEKLLWNIPFNSMSVIGNSATTEDMITIKETENLAIKIMEEVLDVAKSTGNELSYDLVEKNVELTRNMKPYKTSMLLDYENGRQLEIDAILGNVIAIAKENSIDVPYVSTLYSLLKLLTRTI